MKKQSKPKNRAKIYQINPFIQKWFLGVWLTGYALSLSFLLHWVLSQYPDNHNLSSYLLISIDSVLLPLLLFLVTFSTAKKGVTGLTRWFEGALLTSIGIMIIGILNQVSHMRFLHFSVFDGGYWQSISYNLAVTLVGASIFIALLYKYRKTT